ncbi:MAG: DUF1425 domain-containing protein [Planctomycetota bacterium]|nr:MAG: DUF1425 domain-containing protein [Planctomycetota bacterium]
MRSLRPLLLAALPVLAAACSAGPEIVQNEGGPVALQVESSLDEVSIQDLKVRLKDGRATAQFFLVNEAETSVRVHITLEWFDADGFLIEDSMETDPRSRDFDLRPRERRTFTFYSPEGSRPVRLRCVVGTGGW